MEQDKKKVNVKIIVAIVISILVVILSIVVFKVISNKKLEQEWSEKRVEIGDVCVDMGYYATKIKKEMNNSIPLTNTLKELSDSMNKEIDEKMEHLEKLNKTIGKVKTKAQEQWKEDYHTLYLMNEQRDLISKRILGYSLISSNKKIVIEPCDELILIYARSDLRHNEIFSNNEQTIERFNDANIKIRYSEEIEKQAEQHMQNIMKDYFGN